MRSQRTLPWIVTWISLTSLGVAACTQQWTLESKPQSPSANLSPPTERSGNNSLPAGGQTLEPVPDVPYVPTPQQVVDQMLQVAKVTDRDVVYDLGSGDGRIVITAAQKYGARGVGVEINPDRIQEANQNAEQAGVSDRVEFRQQDLFAAKIQDATVVTLYLLPSVNEKLRPKLFQELRPGTRVVSHAFEIGDWKPQQTVQVGNSEIYYWVIPEKTLDNPQ